MSYCKKYYRRPKHLQEIDTLKSQTHAERCALDLRAHFNRKPCALPMPLSWQAERERAHKREMRKIEHKKSSLIAAAHRRAMHYIRGRQHHSAAQRLARVHKWNEANEGIWPPIPVSVCL